MSYKKSHKPCGPCKECEDGCLDFPKGSCIEYSGPNTLFLKIPTGLNIDDIIQGLDTALKEIQDKIDNASEGLNTSSTITITLTGDGKSSDLKGIVNLSTQPGQTLEVRSDGLYASVGSGVNDATFSDDYFDI